MIVIASVVSATIVLDRSRRGRTGWAFWAGSAFMLGGLSVAGLVIVPGLIDRSTWRTFDPSVWVSSAALQGTPTIRTAMARELKGHDRIVGPTGLDVLGQLGQDDAVPPALEDHVGTAGGFVVGWALDTHKREWLLVGTDSDGFPVDVAIEDLP